MALRTTLGAEVVSRRVTTDVLLVGNGNGKPEDYYLGETMGVDSFDVGLSGSGEGYPLVQSLGSEYGAELGPPGGRISAEDSEGIKLSDPGGVSNDNSSGNIGENLLRGVLGAYHGL